MRPISNLRSSMTLVWRSAAKWSIGSISELRGLPIALKCANGNGSHLSFLPITVQRHELSRFLSAELLAVPRAPMSQTSGRDGVGCECGCWM